MGIPSLDSVLLQREDTCRHRSSCANREHSGDLQEHFWVIVRDLSCKQQRETPGEHSRPCLPLQCAENAERRMTPSASKPPWGGHSSAFPRKPPRGAGKDTGGVHRSHRHQTRAYLWWRRLQHRLTGRGDSSGSSRSPVPQR